MSRWLREQREDNKKARHKRAGTNRDDKDLANMTPEERQQNVSEEQRRLMG